MDGAYGLKGAALPTRTSDGALEVRLRVAKAGEDGRGLGEGEDEFAASVGGDLCAEGCGNECEEDADFAGPGLGAALAAVAWFLARCAAFDETVDRS